ncbi:hypothetical protein KRX56_03755 [Dermabacteraceae bacterium TAE3-ERU27]|nr:hypothetical protein [Dermabacteraceae bacterium TAE3-ERU27]
MRKLPLFSRTNFAGNEVSLAEGPAAIAAATLGLALAKKPGQAGVVAGVGALGLLDDLCESPVGASKGLRGHLGRLKNGEVTTGALKAAGIPMLCLAYSLTTESPARVLPAAVTVAGAANVANLFDLRPGRSLKVLCLAAMAKINTPQGKVLIATSLSLLPEDLRGKTMLGDAGANALGALAGLALCEKSSPVTLWVSALAVTGLTLASEKISFSRVIASVAPLRMLDELGR